MVSWTNCNSITGQSDRIGWSRVTSSRFGSVRYGASWVGSMPVSKCHPKTVVISEHDRPGLYPLFILSCRYFAKEITVTDEPFSYKSLMVDFKKDGKGFL